MKIRLARGATRVVQAVMGRARPLWLPASLWDCPGTDGCGGPARAFRNNPAPVAARDGIAFGALALPSRIAMLRPAWKASGSDPANDV